MKAAKPIAKAQHDPLYTLAEAAEYICLSYGYLYRLVKHEKRIPYVQASACGKIRIRLSDLNRFIDKQKHGRASA